MKSDTPRDTLPQCGSCGWVGTRTTAGLAAYALRIHSCEARRRADAARARRKARLAMVDRTPKPCLHKRTQHQHGTHACYVLDHCKCLDCMPANTRYEQRRNRQRAYGRHPYVDAEPARAHVRRLQADGLGWKRICALSGVPTGTMWKLLYGCPQRNMAPSKRIRPTTAAKILAVRAGLHSLGATTCVDGTGTRRRLEALVAIGWSQSKLAGRLGMQPGNFGKTLRSRRVQAGTARAVRALYDELWHTAPPQAEWRDKISVSRALHYAQARGWVPPMAWDDERIDDPAARPSGALYSCRGRLPQGAELAALLISDEPTAAIAARYGVKPAAIRSARARARRKAAEARDAEAVA